MAKLYFLWQYFWNFNIIQTVHHASKMILYTLARAKDWVSKKFYVVPVLLVHISQFQQQVLICPDYFNLSIVFRVTLYSRKTPQVISVRLWAPLKIGTEVIWIERKNWIEKYFPNHKFSVLCGKLSIKVIKGGIFLKVPDSYQQKYFLNLIPSVLALRPKGPISDGSVFLKCSNRNWKWQFWEELECDFIFGMRAPMCTLCLRFWV